MMQGDTGCGSAASLLLDEWRELGGRHVEAARQAPWREGDWIVAGLAGGKLTDAIRAEAARVTRREPIEITRLVKVCQAFPPDSRHAGLSFDHHEAVIKLAAGERGAMLDQAAANGWTAKQTRRQVLATRVSTGDFFPPVDDDPDDTAYRGIAQAWNRASPAARETFMGSAVDAKLREIEL